MDLENECGDNGKWVWERGGMENGIAWQWV